MKKDKILYFLFIVALICFVVSIYNKYYFNDYLKSVKEPKKTSFYRDNEIKYSNQKSYCIETKEYNTAVFSKEIAVKKNTPYKVTCYVKTENVEDNLEKKVGGVNICILDTVEKSESIEGTNDWKKLEFMFNSKNREKVQIGFRLGSYDTDSKGKVWFSDIKLEEGIIDNDTNWNVGCFVFKNLDVDLSEGNLEGRYTSSMNDSDINLINADLERVKKAVPEISLGKMNMNFNIYYIDSPLDTISYEEENGFYIDYIDVYDEIISYVKENKFDHIFVIFKAEDLNKMQVNAMETDWVGLRTEWIF